MERKILAAVIAVLMITVPVVPISYAADIEAPLIEYPLPENNSYKTQEYQDEQLQGKVVMVPAKTTFPAVLNNSLSSETAKVGDNVVFYLDSDFYYSNNLIAPQGSTVNGTVTKVRSGKYGNVDAQIQVKFSTIVTPSRQVIPISASIETEDGSGILKAGTVKDAAWSYTKNVAIGAAAGAILGTALGALSGGGVGKGAIYGTAIGGGLGLSKNAFEKGENIYIPSNSQVNIILDQPVTFSSNNTY